MKVLCQAFMCLQFVFVIFKQKEIGVKADCKMLAKLTTGVNFTNVLQAAFALVDPENVKNAFWLCTHES
jgi:hypothetical protein